MSSGKNLASDTVKRISEKLRELVGDEAAEAFTQGTNGNGELVNEEGLPIIDITEPVTTNDSQTTGNSVLLEGEPLAPIKSLPSPVRDRLTRERDRILDALEEEERRDAEREEMDDHNQREEILKKRREAAAKEKENFKATKEMQKKMGKALLQNMAAAQSKKEAELEALVQEEEKSNAKKDNLVKKKVVSFADVPADDQPEAADGQNILIPSTSHVGGDWGDVAPARLRPSTRSTLLSKEKLTMKMNVVERSRSGFTDTLSRSTDGPDSDDESEPGSPAEQEVDAEDTAHDGSAHSPPDSDAETFVLEEDEYDMDFAQHQREIAIQYHEKRAKIGEAALAAMTSHTHQGYDDSGVDVPLDMPSSEVPKPTISQFKASRLASSYGVFAPSSSASTSLGASVLPASTARTLQRAIRTGKLDDSEKLIGGDADSGSEEETEEMQELLELLKKGEAYNLGPDGKVVHPIPKRSSGSTEAPSSVADPQSNQPPPLVRPPKTSKFKLSRTQAGRPAPTLDDNPSPTISQPPTPISNVARSSPKLPSTFIPTVTERQRSGVTGSLRSTVLTPTVFESQPFGEPSISNRDPKMRSMIVNPPSFAHTEVPSMIVESPSFPSQPPPRPRAPPTIMSSTVKESGGSRQTHNNSESRPEKKVSRFLSERS